MIKPKLPENSTSTSKEKDKYKRSLGECPDTGQEILAYIEKYGPLVQLKGEEQPINLLLSKILKLKKLHWNKLLTY